MSRRSLAALACLLGWLPSVPASAELRREESVGVAPIVEGGGVAREAALTEAVRGAVLRTARSMLPPDFVPPEVGVGPDGLPEEPDDWLDRRLGEDPFVYVSRFRILEDRGSRPAVFAGDPEVEEEYVVLADVSVDADAVRERLAELGLLRMGDVAGRALTLEVQGLTSYRPLALLRETLERDRGVKSVVPVEFTRGRAVLAVRADRDAPALLEDLARAAPEGLQIVVVDQGAGEATLLVDWHPPEPTEGEDAARHGPID